jgi:amino acid adenylation domain-containing protein
LNTDSVSPDATVPQLFRRRVRTAPDNVAVSVNGAGITYSELDQWSDRIARCLVRSGVPSGTVVAVSLGRSAEYVATVLGILKAGCCYVPLDPGYPAARREFILRDSGAQAVIGPWHDGLTSARQITLPSRDERDERDEEAPPDGVPLCPPSPDYDAYIIYTSGSTGTPKGVVVQHRQIVSLATYDERVRVAPGERVAMLAPLSFDASTFELWNTLCGGGEVVIFSHANGSVLELSEQLRLHHPDWLWLTAGLFHMLAAYDPASFDSVGTLITGGDVLSPKYVQEIAARRTLRVLAAYGPTETTTFASLHEVDPERPMRTVPIGRPLTGVTMQVLDDAMGPVPPGEDGELYIGGAGVAVGYRANGTLSAAKFIPDISGHRPGARMYRTGDLAVERADGSFEFRGRIDRQVKIRGHRVEPGEIEIQLSNHPSLAAAAVCAMEDPGGGKRLVAYVVPIQGATLPVAELKAWLAERLPDYMRPATFILLTELPLDTNGKPDRRRLPDPWTRRDQLAGLAPFANPDGEQEKLLADIWAESFGLDQVGLDDDFYMLGGDSLRGVDVIARMRQQGLKVSTVAFFGNPTVRQLARSLGADG